MNTSIGQAWRPAALSSLVLSVGLMAGTAVHAAEPSGTLSLSGAGHWGTQQITLDAAQGTAVYDNGVLRSISFQPGYVDSYPGGFSTTGYLINGSISLASGNSLRPAEGWASDATVTVSVSYETTGAGVFYLDGYSSLTGAERWGSGTFSKTLLLSDVLSSLESGAYRGGLLMAWGGAVPYAQGANGSASTYSTAVLRVTGITFNQGTTVPEAATVAYMALGLVALAWVQRRRSAA